MKNKTIKILSLALCFCLLCTVVPVRAAEAISDNDNATTETLPETDNDNDIDTNTDIDGGTESEPAPEPDEPLPEPEPEPEPLTLNGTMHKKRSVELTWNSDNPEAVYNIYRSTEKDSGFEFVKSKSEVEGTATAYDYTLTIGTTYYYKVDKVVNEEVVETSNTVSVRIRLKPATDITASITSANKVSLSWEKASYATCYTVYRSSEKDGEYTKIATTTKTSYTDKNVESAKAYYYKLYSCKKDVPNARSVASKVTAAYTKTKKPVVSSKYSSKKVTVSWAKVTRADKYYIYRKNSDGKMKKIGETTKLKFTDENVSAKKRYFYQVRAAHKKDGKFRLGFYSDVHSIYTASIDPDKKMVALTFDDGPGPYTQAIVDCLKKNNARATFFVVGERIDTYDDELASAFKNGNEIANHSYTHPNLTKLSSSKVKSEITKTDTKVKNVTGIKTTLLRTPGGNSNATVKEVCGKPIIYWSIDTLDWKTRSKSQTVSSVMNNVRDGDIILMHDIYSTTRDAALDIIPKLKAKGYQLVTVSELAKYRGYTLKNGTTYSSFR